MIVYHAVKKVAAVESILAQMILRPGRNVTSSKELVHVSLKPFRPGSFALDIIGADTNQAVILKLEIPEDTPLEEDPSEDSEIYGGGWKVSRDPIRILKVINKTFIPDVLRWESGEDAD